MKYRIAINDMALTGKLPQGDPIWARFNDSFRNMEFDLLEIANAIYTGHAYATWHDGRRKLDNFICAQHICVDMDTGDERSTIAVLSDHPLVKMYGALIHTTPSHTPETPRSRVMFLLDAIVTNANAYQTAAKFLIEQFDGADIACSDASRFFYGALNCEVWIGSNELPLAHLRRYYRIGGKDKPAQRAQSMQTQPAVQPVQRKPDTVLPEFERVQEALRTIDPWRVDYQKWIAILGALHDEFGDVALPLAEQWAQGKDGEVRMKWRSFGNYSGKRSTLATIFGAAKQH